MAKTTRGLMDLYLHNNYQKDIEILNKFIQRKYKGRFKNNEISDIYHDSLIRVLESKTYKNGKIKNVHAFIWITIRNEIVRKLVKAKLVYEEIENINDVEFLEIDSYYEEIGFNNLMNDIKKDLTPQEYWILINYIYNKLNYKQISILIGYSRAYVYNKNKIIVEKIKKLIDEKGDEYF